MSARSFIDFDSELANEIYWLESILLESRRWKWVKTDVSFGEAHIS